MRPPVCTCSHTRCYRLRGNADTGADSERRRAGWMSEPDAMPLLEHHAPPARFRSRHSTGARLSHQRSMSRVVRRYGNDIWESSLRWDARSQPFATRTCWPCCPTSQHVPCRRARCCGSWRKYQVLLLLETHSTSLIGPVTSVSAFIGPVSNDTRCDAWRPRRAWSRMQKRHPRATPPVAE